MSRAAKLGRHNGYWYTRAGNRAGVYFGRIGEVPYNEALKRFRKHLSTLDDDRKQTELPLLSVAEICDSHLLWAKNKRSPALFRQRQSILNHWCNHLIDVCNGKKLPGHGKPIGRLRGTILSREHVEQYLHHRRTIPCKKTGRPLGDKAIRGTVIALKACWNWAANTGEDDGGGLLPEDHRPLTKLSRGFVAPKDLSEADLPTDEEIEILFRWAAVEPFKVRAGRGAWRDRRPDEYYTHNSQVFADVLRVYHATGARTSELCHALVRDFMPRTRQICLGKHKRVRTQQNPTVRNIQVGSGIYEVLLNNSRGKQTNDPLFLRDDGTPWDQDQINKRLKRVIRLTAGHDQFVRPHITPYSFRDLYISELLMIGTPPFQVAKMAGTSLREIERTYGHFFNRDLAIAQARLEEARSNRAKSIEMVFGD